MDGWTTVDSRKKRPEIRQPEPRTTTASANAQQLDPLQAMDEAWRERSSLKAAPGDSDQSVEEKLLAAVSERLGGVEPQASSSPRKHQEKARHRAPKVKRLRPQSELPRLEPETVQAFLQQLEQKYPGNDAVQLQALVDHLLVTFKNVLHIALPQVPKLDWRW